MRSLVKRSSSKVFKGSAPKEFYGEGYFLRGEGSNYGVGSFIPYDERYLERDRATVRVFLNSIPKLESAIVLGCARGYMVQAFHEAGVHAVGVDLSEWAVENCAEGYEDYVYCGDVCDLSKWGDREFTLAVALDIFEHIRVPDLYKAISEACRVADWVVINVPINPDDEHPDMSDGQDKTHFSVYSKVWWIQRFLERGFEPVDVREHLSPTTSDDSLWADGHDHSLTAYFKRETLKRVPVKHVPAADIKPRGKDFKILWWSNAPFVGTGYGVGTKHVVYPLNKHYDVACLAFYGLEGAAINMNGLKVFPKAFDQFGIDAAELICRNWKPDIMVTLFDVWIGDSPLYRGEKDWFAKLHPRWVPIIPIDHDPIPVPILNQAKQAYHCVAMSKFGLKQLQLNGVNASYIPHGVDTKTYVPVDSREEQRRWLIDKISVPLTPEPAEWSVDDFIIGKVASNKDTLRKGFDRELVALKIFFEQNPDAKRDTRVFWHTNPRFPGAYHLDHYANLVGVSRYIKYTHPFYMYGGVSERNMAKMYQCFDVLTMASRNEGFGIPIIEAESCGVPVVATRSTSMVELVEGKGWIVEPKTWEPTTLLSNQFIPDEWEIAKAYEDAYNNPDKVKSLGEKSRDFAEQYDWDNVVVPLWVNLIEMLREDINPSDESPRGRRLI